MSAEPTPPIQLPAFLQRPLFAFCKSLCILVLTVFYRLRAYGTENIPRGGVLIVANHQSLLDPPIVGVNVHGHFHPMARSTLFDIPLLGILIANLNSIPVRQHGGQDRGAIQTCIERLQRGGVVAVFPEGARTPDGEIHPFASGAALIARRAGVPVVPAALDGAYRAWPRSRRLPALFGPRIRVIYGAPIPVEEFAGLRSADAAALFESRVRELYERIRLDRRAGA